MELKSSEREKVVDRDEILEEIYKASQQEYETHWDETGRIVVQKKKSNINKGKKSKSSGGQFELRVRKDLEKKGWTVDKWSNNVDFEQGAIIPAKRKYNPFSKVMTIGTGFPDFVAFQLMDEGKYKVVGVEVKVGGVLSRIEKEKCKFYLDKKTFSEILIAKKKKEKNKVLIEYTSFGEISRRMRAD